MTNKYIPHVLVLPEDDANRQIANGFTLHPSLNSRVIQVLPPPGGWSRVVESFCSNQVTDLRRYAERRMVLLIDYDGQFPQRLDDIREQIPDDLLERVFILGVLSEPEELKRDLRHPGFEKIGEALADDCSQNTQNMWGNHLLRHNHDELERLIQDVKPFLFNG